MRVLELLKKAQAHSVQVRWKSLMGDLSPHAHQTPHIHPEALARQERIEALQQYQATVADCPLPMRRAEYEDLCSRDVGSSTDEPQAVVWADRRGFVTIRGDEKSMAVLIRAARLMAMTEEDQARDDMGVAAQFPAESLGRKSRVEVAIRRQRVARRLRVIDMAYRNGTQKDFWNI